MILQIQTPQFTGQINRAGDDHTPVISVFRELICFCCRFTDYASSSTCRKYLSEMFRVFCPSVVDSGRCIGAASHISRQ